MSSKDKSKSEQKINIDYKKMPMKERVAAVFPVYQEYQGNELKTSQATGLARNTIRGYATKNEWKKKLQELTTAEHAGAVQAAEQQGKNHMQAIGRITGEYIEGLSKGLKSFFSRTRVEISSADLKELNSITTNLILLNQGIIPGQGSGKGGGPSTFIQNNNISGLKTPDGSNPQQQQDGEIIEAESIVVGDGHEVTDEMNDEWMRIVVEGREKKMKEKRQKQLDNAQAAKEKRVAEKKNSETENQSESSDDPVK